MKGEGAEPKEEVGTAVGGGHGCHSPLWPASLVHAQENRSSRQRGKFKGKGESSSPCSTRRFGLGSPLPASCSHFVC